MKNRFYTIIEFAKPHAVKFGILLLCVLATTFLGMVYPYIFGLLVDEVFYEKNMSKFYEIVFLYGVIFFVNQILHFVLNMSWANLMTKFLFDIRNAVFTKVLSLKGSKLSSVYSGDIVFRMGNDVEQFMNYIHWNTFYFLASILRLIVSICFIASIFWPFAILAIVITPVIVYVSQHFSKRIKIVYKVKTEKSGFLSSWLFEIVKGMREVKLLSALKGVLSDYVGYTVKIERLHIQANVLEIVSERVNSGISLIWQLVLYSVSAIMVINGHVTLGGFTACVSYFGKCISSFNAINNHLTGISGNLVSVDRVCDTLKEESERDSGTDIEIASGDIKFEEVHFSYTEEKEVLKGVNFNIVSGERIALVGHSGEGKSTIASLLLGFYDISKGKILIDGIPIEKYSLHSLRQQIGIVQQETILFDESIRYNLVFSNDKSHDEQIESALKRASLWEYVSSLPDGLDTMLGTGRSALSGGQKQRLAIARVFLKKPKILIFDEATSSLDSEAELVIKESWEALCQNRTILIIAHRLSTISGVDRILVLKDGRIVGNDSHQKLLETCDIYKNLFEEQLHYTEAKNG